MTAADRLRAAVEAALPEGFYVIDPMHGKIADIDCSLRALVLAAVQPIVEELERERDALRAVTKRGNARTRKKTHRHIHFTDEDGCVHPCRCGEPYRDVALKGESDGE